MTAARDRLPARQGAAAPLAAASRAHALAREGLHFAWIDDITVIVEGTFIFNLAGSHWHHADDPSCHGYLVRTLALEIERRRPSGARHQTSAVAGDSAAIDPMLQISGFGPDTRAEVAAGVPSLSKLPENRL